MSFLISQNAFLGAIESGLIYGFVALGIFISFRILEFPDLTVEGSFPMGAAIAVPLLTYGLNPWIVLLITAIAGALAGSMTAALNQIGKIPNLLASILVGTALYSVNLHILNGANMPLMTDNTIFTPFAQLGWSMIYIRPIVLALCALMIIIALWRYFISHIGLAMRASGENLNMSRAQGINTSVQIFIGMALSNALVAIAGALYAQVNHYADSSLGIGTIVLGLAAVIIGNSFLPTKHMFFCFFGCVIGSILYWIIVAFALNGIPGMTPYDLNLITALLIALILIGAKKFGRGMPIE